MHVESGPATKDRNYWIFLLLLCIAFTAWFLRDWAVGYKQKNIEEATRVFNKLGVEEIPPLGETPTEADFERLLAARPETRDQVHEILGEPSVVLQEGPNRTQEIYAGVYGRIVIDYSYGRIPAQSKPEWSNWKKSQEDIQAQAYWAVLPALIAIYAAYRLFLAVTLQVTVDENGLHFRKRHIPFSAMKSFRGFNPKGWVYLHYDQSGQEKRLKLDNYQIEKWGEVVNAVAAGAGLPNPIAEKQKSESQAAPDAERDAASEPADVPDDEKPTS